MGYYSKIDWTDHTWGCWHGCRKVSAGCVNCYMYRDKKRFGQEPTKIVRSTEQTFSAPLRWHSPSKVFVCSWSDFFIEDADPWRDDAWSIIKACPHLTFQILTKRPENIKDRLPNDWPLSNVWLGVTAENQRMADLRLPMLAEIPAVVRFVSIEPMLEPVSLANHLDCIDWVICGGESGPQARTMELAWAEDNLRQCREAQIPFFMKQVSGKTTAQTKLIPAQLQVREFPENV